jgi:hypothetical protein
MRRINIPDWTLAHRVHHFETIRRRFLRACRALKWKTRILTRVDELPLYAAEGGEGETHVYLSSGFHGDEPAGVEALLQFLESGAPQKFPFRWSLLPCVNPWGLQHNVRTDGRGRDLNRLFHRTDLPVIRAVRQWIEAQGLPHLALHLHEDYDAQGMYLYELDHTGKPIGPAMLQAAAADCPPDLRKNIEGSHAKQGWILRKIAPDFFDEIGWPEGPWLYVAGVERVITLETPSEFGIERRVKAHLRAIRKALDLIRK